MSSLWAEPPRIVVLTGAGISKESGLATFRDADGIWATVRLEEVATPETFARDPARVQEFMIITQNIDDLHERAGSRAVVHMHGELLKARCTACGRTTPWYDDLTGHDSCPSCAIEGQLRPQIVWFGEMPLGLDRIYGALAECKIFLAIGTSGSVEPAAGFVAEASRAAAHTVELNLEPSHGHSRFAERVYGPATEIVPAYVKKLLAQI
jgi:NAD-dependent deacetylase